LNLSFTITGVSVVENGHFLVKFEFQSEFPYLDKQFGINSSLQKISLSQENQKSASKPLFTGKYS